MKMFNKVMQTVAVLLIVFGIVAMAGSSGDCDGKCGPGNTISEMLMIASIGLSMVFVGGAILFKGVK